MTVRGSDQSIKQILLLLAAFFTNSSALCPQNCYCHWFTLSARVSCVNQSLETFPKEIDNHIEILNLSRNSLTTIPNDIGRLSSLQILDLSSNKLANLPPQFGDLITLEKLDLTGNLFANLIQNLEPVSRLPKLSHLYLGKNPVSSLEGLTSFSLHVLDVSGSSIAKLDNKSLDDLPELISLSLQGNPLKNLGFIRSERLRWLDLSNCELNLIHPDAFEDVPNLEQLRMAGNPVLVFSSRLETLTHWRLKRLDVSDCNLDRPGLHGLPSLTHALLSRNSIRLLPNRIFARNPQLTHLYLGENELTTLNASSFAGLPQLEVLDLFNNKLEDLPVNLFEGNPNLKLLNLSYNDLKEIPSNLAISAAVVDFSSNSITNVPRESFINMPRLRSLNLGKNRLESFDSAVNSASLRTLILEGNRIVRISNDSFKFLPNLTGLDLSGNRLTEGTNVEILRENRELHTILLHDNPWRCDCEQLYSTYIYLSSRTRKSSLVCESPRNVSGFSWAKACLACWTSNSSGNSKSERIYGLVLMALLICVLVFASLVSIGHTVKTKRRQVALRLQEAERAEARERLMLHRRSQMAEARRQETVPRVHPDELIGPPTYEEAVDMPRLARSLDNLDSISAEVLGQSAQSLDHDSWSRKRRKSRKRPCKRVRSEEDLGRRQNEQRNRSSERLKKPEAPPRRGSRSKVSTRVPRPPRPGTESEEPPSSVETSWHRPSRPKTPLAKQSRRLWQRRNGNSSDDEDSDVRKHPGLGLKMLQLPREPRSGTYRPPGGSITSSPSPVSSPEAAATLSRRFGAEIL